MTAVVLVHGLAHWPFHWASMAAMCPLAWYLRSTGRTVEVVLYDGETDGLDTIVNRVAEVVRALAGPVSIVGHSYGGVIGREVAKQEDSVVSVVAIASPLKGAQLIEWLAERVPWYFRGNKGYEMISAIDPDAPSGETPCYSVSVGLPGRPDFDSCVYRHETEGNAEHVHVDWSEHRVAPLDIRHVPPPARSSSPARSVSPTASSNFRVWDAVVGFIETCERNVAAAFT